MHLEPKNIFRAFKSRNYTLFFTGQLFSRTGMWMQRTAVIWVIYTMTHSALMVGVTTFAEQFPSFLFSPMGGIAADRHNRYKVLMITQIASALQATALAALYFFNMHQVWMILSLSVLLGIINAYDVPARQPMVNDIINDKKDLPNAIAMNSTMNNLARLIGPAMAGFILAKYGAGNCFALNAVSFIAVIVSLVMMKLPKYEPSATKKKMLADFSDGFTYVRRTPEIGLTLLLLTFVCLLVASYNTLLPVYAKEIFNGDAATFGYINAFIGAGALINAVYLAALNPRTKLKRVLFINMVLLGIGLILFSHMTYFPAAMLLAMICGFGTMSVIPICNTIIQVASAPEMRGRAISFFAMAAFGMLPTGSLLVGWVSQWLGAENSILVQGIISIVLALAFFNFLWYGGKQQVVRAKKIKAERLQHSLK